MMNKKILITIGILIITIILISGCIRQSTAPTGEQLTESFSEFKTQYDEKKAQGYDVTEAEGFARKAKQAFDRRDYRTANRFLDEAFTALEEVKIPTPTPAIPTPTPAVPTPPALENVKVVAVYQSIMERRSIDEIANLLLTPDTDFMFRGFYKYCSDQGYGMDGLFKEKFGKPRYEVLADRISGLKAKKPNILIEGAITCSHLDPDDTWVDGTPLSEENINDIVLLIDGEPVNYACDPKAGLLTTDIANPKWRDFIVGWSEKQIDAGVDAIYYDEISYAIKYKPEYETNPEGILETYEDVYWKDIVDRVKAYAASKNKTVYITANQGYVSAINFHPWKYTDIVTLAVEREDINEMRITEDWTLLKEKVIESHGELVPIIIFIDWANNPNVHLGLFSKLSKEDQIKFLRMIDESTRENGILFAYPIHGGDIGYEKPTGYYGEKGKYDSVEEGTYDTIVELSKKRK